MARSAGWRPDRWTRGERASHTRSMGRYPNSGGPIVRRVPEGDDRPRLVCDSCGFIRYENPKIVVGSVATWEGRILLCRRSIEPQAGFWTLPAGFLELHEEPSRRRPARGRGGSLRRDRDRRATRGLHHPPHQPCAALLRALTWCNPRSRRGSRSMEVALFELNENSVGFPRLPVGDVGASATMPRRPRAASSPPSQTPWATSATIGRASPHAAESDLFVESH